MDSLNAMYAFVKVVDAGSISAAARHMKTPKSTLSRRISRLEEDLGAQLLIRTTRKMALTEVGSSYYERCRRIVTELEEAEALVKNTQTSPRGTLRVTAPVQSGDQFTAGLVHQYLQRYPETSVDLLLTNRYVNLTEEGFDVAIRAGVLSDSSLMAKKLVTTRRYVVATPTYLAQRGTPKTPEDLKAHECILSNPHRDTLTWNLSDKHQVHVSGRMRVNDLTTVLEMTLKHFGVSVLPEFFVGDQLGSGALVPLLTDYSDMTSSVYAVYPPGRHLSPKVRAFIDLAAEVLPSEASIHHKRFEGGS